MNLPSLVRKKKIVKFVEKEVEVCEITIPTLLKISRGEYEKDTDILLEHTNLNEEEINNLSIEAFNYLFNEFNELNKEHFQNKEESGEKLDEGK